MTLSSWNKNNILKFSIDNENVDAPLTDFPVLLNLSSGSGINNFDCTAVFDELYYNYDDDFTGEDGDLPNPVLWNLTTGNTITTTQEILNNQLHVAQTFVIGAPTDTTTVTSKYKLSGDFDVEVEIGLNIDANNASTYVWLYAASRWIGINYASTLKRWTSSIDTWTSVTRASTYGKVRMVRTGSSMWSYYKDGDDNSWIELQSGTSQATTDTAVVLQIYCDGGSGTGLVDAWFDNFKINSGTVVWAAGTHPTNRKIAVVYPSVQEHSVNIAAYSSDVLLVIQSEHDDGSTDITDSSSYEETLTFDTTNTIQHSTTEAKFGSSSLKFGVSDHITAYSEYDIGTDDFTSTVWATFPTDGFQENFMRLYGYLTYKQSNGYIDVYNAGTIISTNVAVNTTSWYHFALVRYNGVLKIYINGTSYGGSYSDSSFIARSDMQFSDSNASYDFTGYMEDWVVTRSALWTEDFTPPTSPFAMDINQVKTFTYVHGEQEQLFCEIEGWDQANESAQLWVKVPKILHDQPTDLLLYYDNTQEDNYYVGDTASWPAQQVWPEEYDIVYHLNQDPSVGGACILDSTSNVYHSIPTGTMTTGDLVDSLIGKGLEADGIDDTSRNDTYTSFGASNNFTMGFICKPTTTHERDIQSGSGAAGVDNQRYILYPDNRGSNSGSGVSVGTNGISVYEHGDAYLPPLAVYNATIGEAFHHIYIVYTNKQATIYLNGDAVHTGLTSSKSLVFAPYRIIGGSYGVFQGIVDEINILNISLSDSAIKIKYHSEIDTLINISQANIFQINGYVKEFGEPVQREVYLYDRASGELMDKITSNTLGYYTLKTTISGAHNIVCLDATIAPDFDDLIISKVTPTETI